jgi:hypothetical protein
MDGSLKGVQERVYLGSCAEMTRLQARVEAVRAVAKLNNRTAVVQAQIPFGVFLDKYTRRFILKPDNLSASTQGRYLSFIKNHVRPAFGELRMAEVTARRTDEWLIAKGERQNGLGVARVPAKFHVRRIHPSHEMGLLV